MADAPLVAGVGRSYRLSMLAAAIIAALASIAALSLTARERWRDLSYLRTLGLSARQSLAVTLIEQLPTVLIAGVVGALLGEGMAWAIRPGIDLATFTGPGAAATLQPAWCWRAWSLARCRWPRWRLLYSSAWQRGGSSWGRS